MATWTTQNKSYASSWTGQDKSSSSWEASNQIKAGFGWLYNQAGIAYNATADLISGNTVYYNGIGTVTTWVNQNKS